MRLRQHSVFLCSMGALILSLFNPFDLPCLAAEPVAISAVTGQARLNGRLSFTIKDIEHWNDPRHELSKAILYLDGQPITGLVPMVDTQGDAVRFDLDPQKAKAAWGVLLGRNLLDPTRRIEATIGFADGHLLKPAYVEFTVIQHPWVVSILGAVCLLTFVLFIVLAQKSDILRDRSFTPPVGQRLPYSLAACQLAVWFFVILGSYVLIYLVRFDWSGMPERVLALLGVSGGTALLAKAVDNSKTNSAQAELRQLTVQQATLSATAATATFAPLAQAHADLANVNTRITVLQNRLTVGSTDFLNDILTDADGVSLHRFQMAIWTVVLAIMFIVTVLQTLTMPELDGTLLGLMGISAGTYLGFKVPETHA